MERPLPEIPPTGISAFAIRHYHLTIVIFTILTIFGVLSVFLMPKDLLPASNLPAVQIITFYSGMPVKRVEQELTYMFERYTGQAVGIKSQTSRSLIGVSIVRNFFHSNVELSNAIAQTGSLIMSVLRKLPPGTQPPLILPFDPMASVPLALCAVSGDNKTQSQLQDIGRYWVSTSIQSVPGAMAPTVMGGKLRQINVYLKPQELHRLNFSPVEVLNYLINMNTFIPSGDIRIGDFDYQIISNGLAESIPKINDWYLRSKLGVAIPLSKVGNAEDSHAIQTNVVLIDENAEVYVPIYRSPGANSLEVVDQVRAAMKDLESTLSGFKLSIVSDQSIFIRKAIESIADEATMGGGLAALMVLFFLGSIRATFAVALSLPLSLVGAFAALNALGETLNVMTLGGIALSVGVLVDNAIVVIEVIMHKLSLGKSPRIASIEGAKEVAMPVLASTISTLVVFIPVLFLKGIVHILFAALSVAVITAMATSYFAAMMVIPVYTTFFLKNGQTPSLMMDKGIIGWFQISLKDLTEAYGRSLEKMLKYSRTVLSLSLIFLVAIGVIFATKLGFELFPTVDAGSFQLNVRGPTGTRIEVTADLSKKIAAKLREYIPKHDLEMIITNAGVYYGYSAAFTPNSGPQDVFFTIQLTENRFQTSQYYAKIIRERLPKDFPQIEFGIGLGGLLTSALNGGLVSPIDIEISGTDPTIAHEYAKKILPDVKKIKGAVDVRIQQRFDSPEIRLNIDRRKASRLGFDTELIVKNVLSAVSNSATYNPAIWVDPKTGIDYFFGVQYRLDDASSLDDLMNIPLTSTYQPRSVPLSRVATTQFSEGPIELNHRNLKPVIDIYLASQDRDIAGVAHDAEAIFKRMPPPLHYTASVRGEYAEMTSAVGSMGGGFLLAAALAYLILVAQFRSFLLPAIIMTTVPMGMVGVIVILALTHTNFSIQAAIGCIFVIGIAVAHGVLLIEYILERTKIDPDIDIAIVKGAKARFRPILMTALASILGLLPMAMGMGHGSEANIPLGRAVIGGQIFSTVLNFYLVPALFRIARRVK